MTLTHGSLFSGVGGLDLGFDAAGIETLWQCEINKQATSVLKKHWPDATRYTDIKTVNGAEVKPVDIITFGSPCQDLSVAGKRAGLAGNRSGLYHEAIRVIKEMRDATQNQYPRVAIWENVRGAFSSNDGADFHTALQALANIGAVDVSWRLVNACNFGVPQRRMRVFVVATFGEERAGQILSKPTRLLWHPKQSTGSEQETTGEVEDSTNCEGYDEYNNKLTGSIHHTLRAGTRQSTGVITERVGKPTKSVNKKTTVYAIDSAGGNSMKSKNPNSGVNVVDVANTLTTMMPDPSDYRGGNAIVTKDKRKYNVRRLTPRECERLMGWPDDHTRWNDEGVELSDSARYRMIGNGIVAPVAQWIGENIVEALAPKEA